MLYRKQIRIPTHHRWKANRETCSTHTDNFGYPQHKTYLTLPYVSTTSLPGVLDTTYQYQYAK
jgi:hypothetical protein